MSLTKQQALQWIEDAKADGWKDRKMYNNPMDLSTALTNIQGWSVQVYIQQPFRGVDIKMLKERGKLAADDENYTTPHVEIWGPDRLVVKHNWEEYPGLEVMEKELDKCTECGNRGETVRLGFAGRVCPSCREKYVDQVEYPGWTA